MSHPLSTRALAERAAFGTDDDPDAHHVAAAYHAARATLITDDIDTAADVAALEMALAAAASLAGTLYDDGNVADWLYRICHHYAGQLERLMAELEHAADAESLSVTP